MTAGGRARPARRADQTLAAVVVGAGHCGLAMSKCLRDRGVEHVVLERGEVANAWRTERWDRLRLLTPNWLCRLPGFRYAGDDPDGFLTMPEIIEFIAAYADEIDAPVRTRACVTKATRVDRDATGYRVDVGDETIRCRALVLASGACAVPLVPASAAQLPSSVETLTPLEYRNPNDLPSGGVLVVGASATGLQLADEIHRSGRPVMLSVGEHVRMPRLYRGADIYRWMDELKLLDQRYDEVDDIVRARNVPSPQLIGTPERATLDLNALTAIGVKLVGRFGAVRDGKALFSGGLRNNCAMADLKMNRLLDSIDAMVRDAGREQALPPRERFDGTRVDEAPLLSVDLADGTIRSIVWATGFRPDYSWLDVPVFDHKGKLKHDGGVVDAPGLYAMGLTFMRRRKSSFIHGAEDDANDLADHLKAFLDAGSARPAGPIKGRKHDGAAKR